MNVFSKMGISLVLSVLLLIFADFTSALAAPAMSSPAPGSTLTSTSVTFTGGHTSQDLEHWLNVGTSAGAKNLHGSSLGSGHSRTVSGLPTSGTIYVRWYSRTSSGWAYQDHTYTMGSTSSSTSSSSGSVYYVSTSGNDGNAGTQSAPFRTIRFALGRLVAGNTLFIRGGTYSEVLNTHDETNFPSGTSWSTPVKVTAFNGEQVNFKGSISIGKASPLTQYVIFDGINIDATGRYSGISLNGGTHHIRFINGEVKNAIGSSGINNTYHQDANPGNTFNEFINMHVHHNGVLKNHDHGFYIKTSGVLIERCDIHDNAAWGIHTYVGSSTAPRANNNTYRNNRIHHNGIVLGAGGGITFGAGDNNVVYNNIVWGNQNGISVNGDGNPKNSGVFHNTVYANRSVGILIHSTAKDSQVFNNISFLNHYNLQDYGAGTTISYNLSANPSFKNPSAGDFHLQSGSAAIDTGTTISKVTTDYDGRKRPQGIRPDIGAYEY